MTFPDVSPSEHIYTREEIRKAFREGWPIYFDTMTMQNLWTLHSNPRKSMLDSIRSASNNCYLPYQTQIELYRHANTNRVLDSVPRPGLEDSRDSILSAKETVLAEVAKVRPASDGEGPDKDAIIGLANEVDEEFKNFDKWHSKIEKRIKEWLGEPVDVEPIRNGQGSNVLLNEIADAFCEGHLLPDIGEERRELWIAEYKERAQLDDPVGPGRTDWKKSTPERSAGDYLMWREIMTHCHSLEGEFGFIFVTDEKKADLWERRQTEGAIRRIDPRIQAEVLQELRHPMLVVSFTEFLEFTTTDENKRGILINISNDAGNQQSASRQWTLPAYESLLELLTEWGKTDQRNVIEHAARNNGYVDRATIGKILGWGDEKKYLTRFRMPADRAYRELIRTRKDLDEGTTEPLWAVYEGPGEAIGYAVPDDFAALQLQLDDEEIG